MKKLNSRLVLFVLITGFLFSCAPVVKKEKTKVIESPIELPMETPVVKPEPLPSSVPVLEVTPPEPESVLILLSNSASSYQKVAGYLAKRLGNNTVQITLSGLPAQDRAVIKDIENSTSTQIVALGLKAITAIKDFENKQIFYTQVLNHHNFFTDNIKAVSALPSPEKLFKDWKRLSPNLKKVAVVSGDNLDLYLARANTAAKAQGIELIVEQVKSDKAFIYRSKKMPADIGGQWILPDNRVLSGKALKEVMAFASRRGRQVVVFSPKLLSFGGFFYVSPDLDAVADGVLQRLSESAGKAAIMGENVLPVMKHVMGINQKIAKQFNLTIPEEYREYLNGQ